MAWTVPMTFTANTALTAAQLNTHLRDNLLECSPAKATQAGQVFVASSRFKIAARLPSAEIINTAETSTAGDYEDLDTPGPTVTVTTGRWAWLFYTATTTSTSADAARLVNFTISGATERDTPVKSCAIRQDGNSANNGLSFAMIDFINNLNPGENTFTLKYTRGSGTTTFERRRLIVWPL